MKQEHDHKPCNNQMLYDEIRSVKEVLTQQISAQGSDIKVLQHVIFGNDSTDEIGMKQKVDEIHTIITQLKGLKWILGGIILVSATLGAIKAILWK